MVGNSQRLTDLRERKYPTPTHSSHPLPWRIQDRADMTQRDSKHQDSVG